MSFNEETVKNVAKLSRLRFEPAEAAKFTKDIEGILEWVEQLKEVDVSNVEPLVSVSVQEGTPRQDVVTVGDIQAELMQNAPESAHGFYVVPKMVE